MNTRHQQLVTAVRRHALANYEKGWDVVTEAWTDEEILVEVRKCHSDQGAIRKMGALLRILADCDKGDRG